VTGAAAPAAQAAPGTPRVLVFDADGALFGLLQEWLGEEGCSVHCATCDCDAHDRRERCDLAVIDLAFPREDGAECVRRVARCHPQAPILALSSAFFAGIHCQGTVARALGASCVLAKPASREALTRAVRGLLSGA
jgi:CheY-like chemotaxis protein